MRNDCDFLFKRFNRVVKFNCLQVNSSIRLYGKREQLRGVLLKWWNCHISSAKVRGLRTSQCSTSREITETTEYEHHREIGLRTTERLSLPILYTQLRYASAIRQHCATKNTGYMLYNRRYYSSNTLFVLVCLVISRLSFYTIIFTSIYIIISNLYTKLYIAYINSVLT